MKKKWIKNFSIVTIISLFVVGGINFIIDPFQQYRQASFYKPFFGDGFYLNPGISKNYDYNSIIIGSSMTQNFVINDAKILPKFYKPIKLCLSGGSSYEFKLTLDVAFKNKKIDAVLYGFDPYSFHGSIRRFSNGKIFFPQYLYDENFINDYRYLLNIDTLKKSALVLLYQKTKKQHPRLKYNTMYQWQQYYNESFGKEKVLKIWRAEKKTFNKHFKKDDYELKKMKESFINNLLPFIENNPNTLFYIFYPPYSVLAYQDMLEKEWFENMLALKALVFEDLKQYPNVKIFDFQIATQVTNNLDNYKDITHYHKKINKWILEQIRDNEYLVSSRDIVEKNNIYLRRTIHNYIKNMKGVSNAIQ